MPLILAEAVHPGDPLLADLGGEYRAEPVPPETDGFVADVDPAFVQKILDILNERGKRTYIITASRMTSGDALK